MHEKLKVVVLSRVPALLSAACSVSPLNLGVLFNALFTLLCSSRVLSLEGRASSRVVAVGLHFLVAEFVISHSFLSDSYGTG